MENLEELFKKFVYAGVGMVSMAKDSLEKTIEEMIEKNRMSTAEGEKIVKEFVDSADSKTKEIKETINKIVDKAKTSLKYAHLSELEELKNRVKILEDLMNKKN